MSAPSNNFIMRQLYNVGGDVKGRFLPSEPPDAPIPFLKFENNAVMSFKTQIRTWRPDISDVERLSRGLSARHRGTGSRRIPHRLNQEERLLYELAKDKASDREGGDGRGTTSG